jgi:hypothetical protein
MSTKVVFNFSKFKPASATHDYMLAHTKNVQYVFATVFLLKVRKQPLCIQSKGMTQAFNIKQLMLMVAEGTIEANHELVSRSDITFFDSK